VQEIVQMLGREIGQGAVAAACVVDDEDVDLAERLPPAAAKTFAASGSPKFACVFVTRPSFFSSADTTSLARLRIQLATSYGVHA
jgi:hypothetical protein